MYSEKFIKPFNRPGCQERLLQVSRSAVAKQESYTWPTNLVHAPENFEMTKFTLFFFFVSHFTHNLKTEMMGQTPESLPPPNVEHTDKSAPLFWLIRSFNLVVCFFLQAKACPEKKQKTSSLVSHPKPGSALFGCFLYIFKTILGVVFPLDNFNFCWLLQKFLCPKLFMSFCFFSQRFFFTKRKVNPVRKWKTLTIKTPSFFLFLKK